jgi:hypothetical protein
MIWTHVRIDPGTWVLAGSLYALTVRLIADAILDRLRRAK